MSVQCGSMNSSTTTLPRSDDRDRVRPFWSVSVNPGAERAGTGDRPIRLICASLTLAGIPDGRATCGPPRARMTAKTVTIAAPARITAARLAKNPAGPAAPWLPMRCLPIRRLPMRCLPVRGPARPR